jgi:hypothetical protein
MTLACMLRADGRVVQAASSVPRRERERHGAAHRSGEGGEVVLSLKGVKADRVCWSAPDLLQPNGQVGRALSTMRDWRINVSICGRVMPGSGVSGTSCSLPPTRIRTRGETCPDRTLSAKPGSSLSTERLFHQIDGLEATKERAGVIEIVRRRSPA